MKESCLWLTGKLTKGTVSKLGPQYKDPYHSNSSTVPIHHKATDMSYALQKAWYIAR